MTLELEIAQRGFPDAQTLLTRGRAEAWRSLTVGWHGTSVSPLDGSFALVGIDSGLDELIGNVVAVQFGIRTVYVYVLDSAEIYEGAAISLTRRCYAFLARLGTNTIAGMVAVTNAFALTVTPTIPAPPPPLTGIDGGAPWGTGVGDIDGGIPPAAGAGDVDGGMA